MKTVTVIYGSTTGNTACAAQQIATLLDGKAVAVADATAADFEADLLVLGCSTWGLGELQDDWAMHLGKLSAANLTDKSVALFGFGDQIGFDSTFQDALGILLDEAEAKGAKLIGAWSADGYKHSSSRAVRNDMFVGLALDDGNESDLTAPRIEKWCELLRAALV